MNIKIKEIIEILKDKYGKDYKKLIITLIIAVSILLKIVFPGIERVLGQRHKLELESGNLSQENVLLENNNGIKTEKNIGNSDFDKSDNFNDLTKNEEKKEITVYVSGAVSNPSVITISSDKRLDDAIKKVGGLTKDADYERINLAMKLEDSQHYIIPYKNDNEGQNSVNSTDITGKNFNNSVNNNVTKSNNLSNNTNTVSNINSSSSKININIADQTELEKIPGVGPSTAKKIIDYRTNNGKFSTIDDIKKVSGIGDKKFESMKDSIIVN